MIGELLSAGESLSLGVCMESGHGGQWLARVRQALTQGFVADVSLVPVGISYDCPPQQDSLSQAGVRSLLRFVFSLLSGDHRGGVRIHFAQPFSLREMCDSGKCRVDGRRPLQELLLPVIQHNRMDSIFGQKDVSWLLPQSYLPELPLTEREMTIALTLHLMHSATSSMAVMSTSIVSCLILHKHRRGVRLSVLCRDICWLLEEILFRNTDVGFGGSLVGVVYFSLTLLRPHLLLAAVPPAGDPLLTARPEPHALLALSQHCELLTHVFIHEAVGACAVSAMLREVAGCGGGGGEMEFDVALGQEELTEKSLQLTHLLPAGLIPPCLTAHNFALDAVDSMVRCGILIMEEVPRDTPVCDFWRRQGVLSWTATDDTDQSDDSDCEEQIKRSYKENISRLRFYKLTEELELTKKDFFESASSMSRATLLPLQFAKCPTEGAVLGYRELTPAALTSHRVGVCDSTPHTPEEQSSAGQSAPRPPSKTEPPSSKTKHPSSTTKPPPSRTKSPSSRTKSPSSRTKPPPSKTKPPTSKTKPPPSKTKPPQSKTKPPPSTTKSPSSKTKPPPSTTKPPPSKTKPPPSKTKPPPSKTKPPQSKTKPPPSTTKPPPSKTKPPPSTTKSPSSKTKPPPSKTKPPTSKTKPPRSKTKPPPSTTKPPPSKTKHPPSKTKPPTSKPNPLPVKPNTLRVKPNTLRVKPNPLPVKPNPLPVKPNTLRVKPNTLRVKPNPSHTTKPPPSTTKPPPSTTKPPPSKTKPPPSKTKPPPSKTKPPPSKTKPPPSKTKLRPSKTKPPPSKTKPPPSKTKLRPSQTKPPPSQTKPPPSKTKPPPSKTKLRPSKTKPPPSKTKPPPSKTKPPPSKTKPPPSKTKPPPSKTKPPPSKTKPPPKSSSMKWVRMALRTLTDLGVLTEDRQREAVYLDASPVFLQPQNKQKLLHFVSQFL
ncbi:hypothetical protein NFI96_033532 [Prochilodus magdalenae]|nr:hypothetical protein NFI96_033532 [Prochilodus magdalenae]